MLLDTFCVLRNVSQGTTRVATVAVDPHPTGAGIGIGAACPARLDSEGMCLMMTDMHAATLRVDVTDEAEVEAAFDAAERQHGATVVLVTCA